LSAPWSGEELERRLRQVLDERYHHRHPFNVRMHAGTLEPAEIRTWVHNRYYYQTRIPIKDGLILSKSSDPRFRREWIRRIHDHDGRSPGEGGLELWLALADAVGLERAGVEDASGVLPGVRRACDDYVRFVESHDLLESVASSLTELAAAGFMAERIEAFEKHYPWVAARGLAYFRSRTVQAGRDSEEGLRFVLDEARTRADQERCLRALETKCDILGRLLDAVEAAHARPRLARHAKLREEGAETLVVLPERAVRLSESGREILDLCSGERSALEIAAELERRHPDEEDVADDAHVFLAEMKRLGVLERDADGT
jgi:pyrroloquinoline-quinone synthase